MAEIDLAQLALDQLLQRVVAQLKVQVLDVGVFTSVDLVGLRE